MGLQSGPHLTRFGGSRFCVLSSPAQLVERFG
jgi:hypothetical protein